MSTRRKQDALPTPLGRGPPVFQGAGRGQAVKGAQGDHQDASGFGEVEGCIAEPAGAAHRRVGEEADGGPAKTEALAAERATLTDQLGDDAPDLDRLPTQASLTPKGGRPLGQAHSELDYDAPQQVPFGKQVEEHYIGDGGTSDDGASQDPYEDQKVNGFLLRQVYRVITRGHLCKAYETRTLKKGKHGLATVHTLDMHPSSHHVDCPSFQFSEYKFLSADGALGHVKLFHDNGDVKEGLFLPSVALSGCAAKEGEELSDEFLKWQDEGVDQNIAVPSACGMQKTVGAKLAATVERDDLLDQLFTEAKQSTDECGLSSKDYAQVLKTIEENDCPREGLAQVEGFDARLKAPKYDKAQGAALEYMDSTEEAGRPPRGPAGANVDPVLWQLLMLNFYVANVSPNVPVNGKTLVGTSGGQEQTPITKDGMDAKGMQEGEVPPPLSAGAGPGGCRCLPGPVQQQAARCCWPAPLPGRPLAPPQLPPAARRLAGGPGLQPAAATPGARGRRGSGGAGSRGRRLLLAQARQAWTMSCEFWVNAACALLVGQDRPPRRHRRPLAQGVQEGAGVFVAVLDFVLDF
ncbi:unnamed protein product [Prorocentrum cordatum]|uniref:Uncharacterized protein n=1 Tax=Prorocentrum cordatum TaxID=2364126 RepID=A0ABN9RML3_9DINO|nr:unnamed protein product [Polarella glacialis]